MVKNFICVILVFFFLLPVHAGQLITLSGYIRDAKTGEDLIGATVSVKEFSGRGTVTNSYGFYSLSLPSGQYQITAQYMGYELLTQKVSKN